MRRALAGVLVVGAVGWAACAARPAAQPERLARADAELLQGCHDCLIAARAEYRRLAEGSDRRVLQARVVEADLLIALREKELDLPPSDAIGEARRIASELPRELEAERYVALVEVLTGQPPGASRYQMKKLFGRHLPSPGERDDVRAWLASGRLRAPLRDYLRLAFDCEHPVMGSAAASSSSAEPLPRAAPLLAYRAAICGLGPIAALAAVREREPRFVEVSLFIANVELAAAVRDGPGQAGAHLAEVRARFPASPAIHFLSGVYELLVENYEAALQHDDRALALVPAHDRALLGRVICLTNLGRHDEAIAAATRLLEVDDAAAADAYYWRARNHHALHRLDEARREIAAAREIVTTADILSLAGVLAYEASELDAAEADLSQATAMGGDCTARWYLALVHRQRKRWLASGHAFDVAMACYRDRAEASRERLRVLLGRADLDPGYRERASASMQVSIEADAKQLHIAALLAASGFSTGGDLAAARPLIDLAGEDPALADPVSKLRARLDPPRRER
jgi:tetratricopeptide (TPR) repeat protein